MVEAAELLVASEQADMFEQDGAGHVCDVVLDAGHRARDEAHEVDPLDASAIPGVGVEHDAPVGHADLVGGGVQAGDQELVDVDHTHAEPSQLGAGGGEVSWVGHQREHPPVTLGVDQAPLERLSDDHVRVAGPASQLGPAIGRQPADRGCVARQIGAGRG